MLGDTIRKYRIANQMTEEELAKKLGTTEQAVLLWESGQAQPSLDSIVALARAFQISADTLMEESEADLFGSMDFISVVSDGSENYKIRKEKNSPLLYMFLCVAAVLLVVFFLLLRSGRLSRVLRPSPAQTGTTTTVNSAPSKTKVTPATTTQNARSDFYRDLSAFALDNGQTNGRASYFIQPSNNYGGAENRNFIVSYVKSSGELSFGLYTPAGSGSAVTIYIFIPQSGTKYTYEVSYTSQDGEVVCQTTGSIPAKTFDKEASLPCSQYIGDEERREEFMETTHDGVYYLLSCAKQFLEKEEIGYSMSDIGFKQF